MPSKTEYLVRIELPGGADSRVTTHRSESVARRIVRADRANRKGSGYRVTLTRVVTYVTKLRV